MESGLLPTDRGEESLNLESFFISFYKPGYFSEYWSVYFSSLKKIYLSPMSSVLYLISLSRFA